MRLNTQTEKELRIKELDAQLIEARNYIDEENRTTYANSDWSSASESPVKRIQIEQAAWANDADEVEHVHHGVKVNGRYIISMNHKWSDRFKKWYPYGDIDKLFKGLLG